MDRKILKATVAFIAFIIFTTVIYAGYIITSPTVRVTVQEPYTLSLSANQTSIIIGETINFTGYLTQDGTPISEKTVELFYNKTTTTLTDTTDANGFYSILWTSTQSGTFDFNTTVVIEP